MEAGGVLGQREPAGHGRGAGPPPPRPRDCGGPGEFPEQVSEFASDEVAAALTLTSQAASTYSDVALDLAIRLPGTARAHHEGLLDYRQVRLITEATRILTAADARAVESQILAQAVHQTTGQLRASVARAVIAVDPQAATRRREEAQRDPRVRRWQEDAGTAALAGYNLPPAEVLAADQQLTTRALALRDAGLPGSVEELRAAPTWMPSSTAIPPHRPHPARPPRQPPPARRPPPLRPPSHPARHPPRSTPPPPLRPAPRGWPRWSI